MTERYIALRDRRLTGGVPSRPNLCIINTDANTPLYSAFQSITAYAARGRVKALYILCHGYSEKYEYENKMSMEVGKADLQLGREGLNHGNVASWAAIREKTQDIVVYSCLAAYTRPGLTPMGTTVDGTSLMRKLAQYTNATIYASNQVQWYSHGGTSRGAYDFGEWEGTLLRFRPSGVVDEIRGNTIKAPVEISEVFSGKAP